MTPNSAQERMSLSQMNRETWLTSAVDTLRPFLKSKGYKVPNKVRITCGFAAGTSKRLKKDGSMGAIGQCWHADNSGDKTHEIFISPTLDDPVRILDVTTHELLHAALPKGTGHRGPFARACKTVGLEGKPTRTHAGDELEAQLREMADQLGPYPHAALAADFGKRQGTRLIKVLCPDCGYNLRTTTKWLDACGAPICPVCHIPMQAEFEGEVNALPIVESHVEYKIDDQYTVRFARTPKSERWTVLDWGTDMLGPAQPRIVNAEGRQDALDVIDALREGLYTHEELAEQMTGEDYDPETDDPHFLDEDEDEWIDNPEDTTDPEYEDQYPAHDPVQEMVTMIYDGERFALMGV